VMQRPMASDRDVEMLHESVNHSRELGVSVPAADRELRRLRAEQVRRDSAEEDLIRAIEELGPKARESLAEKLRHAKRVGVPAVHVRKAGARLRELDDHERLCGVVAGKIRRALPLAVKEPWRLQEVLKMARKHQPWTLELERLVQQGNGRLKKLVQSQRQCLELTQDLESLVGRIKSQQASGQAPSPKDVEALESKLAVAKAAEHTDSALTSIVQEGRALSEGFRFEKHKREVVEQRLKLALKARKTDAIEAELRHLRSLDVVVADSGALIRGTKIESTASCQLIEPATAVLRHLREIKAKRQTPASTPQDKALGSSATDWMSRLADNDLTENVEVFDAKTSKAWIRSLTTTLTDGRPSAVAVAASEHAKMKVRKKHCKRAKHELQAVFAFSSMYKRTSKVVKVQHLRNFFPKARASDAPEEHTALADEAHS